MSDSKTASIFPLPLVAFERYMLADDRPEYPMTFTLTLRLAGTVDREAFEAAADEALARHPLLVALVEGSSRRRPRWVSSGARRPPLDWGGLAAPLRCPRGEAIDLAREPGLRLWVRQGDGRAEVTGQFHHACCDGIGGLVFFGDVLACYAMRVAEGDDLPALKPSAIERLRARGDLGRGRVPWRRRLARLLGTLSHAARFSYQRPTSLAAPPAAPLSSRPEPFSGTCRRELSEEVSGRLREVARRRGATVNDLLLRDMFLTIAAWNTRWGRGSRRAWLRILMPANLRVVGERAMPAANVVGMSFLSRRAGACDDAGRLLDGIRRETLDVKRTRRGLRFIHVIEWAQRLCGGMPRLLVGDRCVATAVLSNVGDAARWFTATFPRRSGRLMAGNLVLEGVTGAPPIRPKTSAAVMISRCAGETSVSLRCDPRRFAPERAEGLLAAYVDRLVQTSQEADS
jgi:hypothetical protein